MEITINLDDDLLREAMAIHRGKTSTAVLELALRELINADRRRERSLRVSARPAFRPPPALGQ